ncbi:hypothetical protein L596_005874 [Steinernema carpocapsae]|uniref:Uncharacterized protein n=1 Tax=Steinernema carpocapsae TaxID=34508 RepID=A0A4U8V0H9_STECR|nr:hypothetical protein L596_005874 [Steinernema carpocapsae]
MPFTAVPNVCLAQQRSPFMSENTYFWTLTRFCRFFVSQKSVLNIFQRPEKNRLISFSLLSSVAFKNLFCHREQTREINCFVGHKTETRRCLVECVFSDLPAISR